MSNNNHKMKGLLKGLRYISQIFDEEKEQEMKIGFPTDVKHVAHIGWDGPSAAVDSSPSWMKDFKAPGAFQSAPLNGTGPDSRDKPEIKWVSEDSNRRSTRSEGGSSRDRELPDVPRSRRHASSENITVQSSGKEGSTKSRQSRKSKESSKSSRQGSNPDAPPESPSKKLPDIPKKSRRKKSKEDSVKGGSTRSSRSKANNDPTTDSHTSSPFSDPGPDNGYEYGSNTNKELTSNLKPFVEEQREGK